MEKILKNENETARFANELARELTEKERPKALVLGLVGELGAGKTTFTQYFLRALGLKEPVMSPTFVLMREYNIEANGFKRVCHIDLYRLKETDKDLEMLGFLELAEDSKNLIIVEWADRARDSMPVDTVWIELEHVLDKARRVRINN